MENIYTAYTKKVNNETLYFVKRYISFNDIKGSPQILSDFGMHSKFSKACAIAQIYDERIVAQLSRQVQQVQIIPATDSAKVIEFNPSKQSAPSFLRNTQHFLSKFRLAGLN